MHQRCGQPDPLTTALPPRSRLQHIIAAIPTPHQDSHLQASCLRQAPLIVPAAITTPRSHRRHHNTASTATTIAVNTFSLPLDHGLGTISTSALPTLHDNKDLTIHDSHTTSTPHCHYHNHTIATSDATSTSSTALRPSSPSRHSAAACTTSVNAAACELAQSSHRPIVDHMKSTRWHSIPRIAIHGRPNRNHFGAAVGSFSGMARAQTPLEEISLSSSAPQKACLRRLAFELDNLASSASHAACSAVSSSKSPPNGIHLYYRDASQRHVSKAVATVPQRNAFLMLPAGCLRHCLCGYPSHDCKHSHGL